MLEFFVFTNGKGDFMNRVKCLVVSLLLLVISIMLSGCVARYSNVQTNEHESLTCTEHSENRTEEPDNLTESSAPMVTASSAPVVTASPTPEPAATLPPGATLGSIVVSIPVGNGKGELCFREFAEDVANEPTDFLFDGDEIYVLNSAGGNILCYRRDGLLTNSVKTNDPAPQLGYYPYKLALGSDRLYVVDYNRGEVSVFAKDSGTLITSCKLPAERVCHSGDLDPLDFWYGYNFAGSIIQMYEVGGCLVFVVHDTFYTITTYFYDVDAGTIMSTKERGLSGDVHKTISLVNNETGAVTSFSLDGWTMDRILGFDSVGSVYVSAFLETDYQPCPRKVFAVGSDGSIAAESATVEDSGYIGFSLGNDSIVYAMIRDGDHVNLVRVNLY